MPVLTTFVQHEPFPGRRVEVDATGCIDGKLPNPGDYFLFRGSWYGMTPNGHLAGLGLHVVAENPDGTITVSPSILVSWGDAPLWHGHLINGEWRSC